MQSLLMVEPAVVVRDLPRRLFAALHPDFAIPILMASHGIVPASSSFGPAQQQATRRFLASIDRVRGAAIQAR
ncbi:hypothetical protein CQ13_02540 [Bradyrhizobium retamae]|uniref:Uncharacterized protein n=1 Tax=Bradyrhizobium retamae TaxID=1300035 RepID=A0A0R3N530_9BRAD|nr:hypothetical protein CQ13_02540 [Bradyrhizobium retamae]